LFVLLRTVAVE